MVRWFTYSLLIHLYHTDLTLIPARPSHPTVNPDGSRRVDHLEMIRLSIARGRGPDPDPRPIPPSAPTVSVTVPVPASAAPSVPAPGLAHFQSSTVCLSQASKSQFTASRYRIIPACSTAGN
jgi:hypothetical protein